jgi:hypothetical protein
MIRKLFVIAGAGFVLSLACLAGTAVLVRHDLKGEGFNLTNREIDDDFHLTPVGKITPQPLISKTLDFAATDSLGIDLPADVVITQGPTASLSVTGSKDLVERLRYSDGRLYLTAGNKVTRTVNLRLVDGKVQSRQVGGELKITITAPSIKRFNVTGTGDVTIKNYDQPEMTLNISGAGQVDAEGKTKTLKLDISGVGDADLEKLMVTDADVHISGMGDADIAATGSVKTNISGTGNITLRKRPVSLEKHISGMGNVDVEDE